MTDHQKWLLLTALILAAGVFALYAPTLGYELRSDDFQWVQQAHRAQVAPAELFSDLDTFYRPVNVWTLLLDRQLWGVNPFGFHLTNLLLHVFAALALAVAARRLGLSPLSSTTLALLWALSPFAEESAVWISARFQDFLLIAWAGVIASWPRRGEEWTLRRRIAVLAFLLVGAAAKESWVVIPAVGLALEYHRTRNVKSVIRAVAPLCVLSGIYVVFYFVSFPGDKNYFSWSLSVLAKLPHMFAAFFHFEELLPTDFSWTWQAVVATLALGAAATWGVLRGSMPVIVATICLVLSALPVLLVPFLPTRHTLIPYAAFLLIMAATVEALGPKVPQRYRRASAGALVLFLGMVLAAGVSIVRADLVDHGRISVVTTKLLRNTRAVLPHFALDRPVIVVRDESENPLHEVAMNPHGRLKIWYVRRDDPYGLVDTAALFDWALGVDGPVVERVDDWEERLDGVPGVLLVHRPEGFSSVAHDIDDTAAVARHYKDKGLRLQVVDAR